jgi:dihydrofolate reductase
MATQKKQAKKAVYTAYVASSIDGRIAKSGNSGTDWTSKEDWNFFQKSLNKADAVIAGHNTYNIAKKGLDKRNTIVLTSKVKKFEIKGKVVFLNPEKADLKKFIESKKYKNIAVVGGAKVYDFCLAHKMLDEIFVTIEPYVFSSGVQMFQGMVFKKYKFKLEEIKKLNKQGTLLLKYSYAG